MAKKVLFAFIVIVLIVFLSLPILFMCSIMLYSPCDECILDYVEDLIQQDMDAYDCEIIERDFSTNVREYSLYVVVQINSDFDVSEFEMDCAYPEKVQQLLQKAYGSDSIPQCCYYITAGNLNYVFDQSRNWLILDWE